MKDNTKREQRRLQQELSEIRKKREESEMPTRDTSSGDQTEISQPPKKPKQPAFLKATKYVKRQLIDQIAAGQPELTNGWDGLPCPNPCQLFFGWAGWPSI